jgi:hypothetical protein
VLASRLLVEHEEGEVVSILLIGDDQQQILPDFAIPKGALKCELTHDPRLVHVDDLHLPLRFFLKDIPSAIQGQHLIEIGYHRLTLMVSLALDLIEDLGF